MKAHELIHILNVVQNKTVVFEIEDSNPPEEPKDTSYSIDEILITDEFVVLRSVD